MMEINNLVVFDGMCNFCSGAVMFIVKRDHNAIFRFAPMQSHTGQELLKQYGMDPNDVQTILLVKDGRLYMKSNAALEIAREFQGFWRFASILRIIPEFLRDWFYDLIADNRYRWFGKKEVCMVPPENVRERFLLF